MLLAADLSTGHKVALIVVAVTFIVFALVSSFGVQRWKPDFPGPNGIGVFAIGAVAMFVLMVLAINFFG